MNASSAPWSSPPSLTALRRLAIYLLSRTTTQTAPASGPSQTLQEAQANKELSRRRLMEAAVENSAGPRQAMKAPAAALEVRPTLHGATRSHPSTVADRARVTTVLVSPSHTGGCTPRHACGFLQLNIRASGEGWLHCTALLTYARTHCALFDNWRLLNKPVVWRSQTPVCGWRS